MRMAPTRLPNTGGHNKDGSREDYNPDSWDDWTHSPTARWPTICLMLSLTLLHDWKSIQLDYVQAFPQAPLKKPEYIELPPGIEIEGISRETHVLKLLRNIYGRRAASRDWFLYLKDKLVNELKFTQSKYDECLFYRGSVMYVLYTDDSILAGPNQADLDQAVKDIERSGLKVTHEGTIDDFLGVNIKRENGKYHLCQPKLIESILDDLGLNPKKNTTGNPVKTKPIPMPGNQWLGRHLDSPDFDGHFHFRRAIGKLNFLADSTRGDISYVTHHVARYVNNPKKEHGEAIKYLGRYLAGTMDKGYVMTPDPSKGVEIYVDASFCQDWDPSLAGQDIDTARSRYGYIITYAGVPLVWKSSLATEVCLSTTEAELVGLSQSLRAAIPIINILNEMKGLGFNILPDAPVVHSKLFEDNSGALAIAKFPKMRPRTKHLNAKMFHFVEFTTREDNPFEFLKIHKDNLPADALTKPLAKDKFEKHRKWLLGW